MGQLIKGDFVMTPAATHGWMGKVISTVGNPYNIVYVEKEGGVEHMFNESQLVLVHRGPGIPPMGDDAEYNEILAAQEIMDKLQP